MIQKKRGARLLWVLLALFVAVSSASAQTPESKPTAPVVIVVDITRIQRDSLAGKAVVAQREKYQQSFQAEFENSRKLLQQKELDLSKQRTVLGPQGFEEAARAFNEEVAAFQRRYQSAIRALDKSTATAMNQLQKATIEATSELASEMGAGLVLHKQNVFLHDERMEVTDAVIERLNKRLPSVTFPIPVVEGDADAKTPAKPAKK